MSLKKCDALAYFLNAKCMFALSNVAVQVKFSLPIVCWAPPATEFAPSVAVEL